MENHGKGDYELYYLDKKNNLDLSVYSCGWQECAPGYAYGPCERNYYLIHFIRKGEGYYYVGGKQFHIKQNEGFIIHPSESTKYMADENNPWEYYWVAFHGTEVKNILAEAGLENSYVFSVSNPDEIILRMKNMIESASRQKYSAYRIIGEMYILFSWLVKNASEQQKLESKNIVNKAIAYINNNYYKNISVSDVAESLNVDRTTLYRNFERVMSLSPQNYLLNFRLDKSLVLLNDTNLSIKEIAYSVGFGDYPHFCRLFKKYFSVTPSEYRKKPFETLDVIK